MKANLKAILHIRQAAVKPAFLEGFLWEFAQ
jgi:hypothetical protein